MLGKPLAIGAAGHSLSRLGAGVGASFTAAGALVLAAGYRVIVRRRRAVQLRHVS